MKRWGLSMWLAVVAAGLLTLSTAAADDGAAQAYREGEALLQQARFEEALASYDRAAQLDAARQEYREAAAILKRVVQLRDQLTDEPDPAQWERVARALRAYYRGEGILTASLALDRQIHERLGTAESAEMLADTQLELGQTAEARALLAGRTDLDARPGARLLLGIAQARAGATAEARAIAQGVALPADASAEDRVRAARLQAIVGDRTQALALLAAAFEATPPSQLEAARARVKACPDFAGLNGGEEFAKVLATQSKVAESGCGKAKTCGGCPNRTACSSASAATAKPK